jgi:large subunit ribosomal protein L29
MATASDLAVMDPEELELRLAESRTELLNLRFQVATGQLDNSARLGHVRRDIARILTVMRQREIEEVEGMFVPVATLETTARQIQEIDEAAAAEHPGDQRYQDLLAEDEALVEEFAPADDKRHQKHHGDNEEEEADG